MSTENSRGERNPLSFASEVQRRKLPPQATDLEEEVLGALMLDKNAVAEVIDILKTGKLFIKNPIIEFLQPFNNFFIPLSRWIY